jgi:hypothetical protein
MSESVASCVISVSGRKEMDRVKTGICALQNVWLRAMAQPTQQQSYTDATISSARASCNQWMDDSLKRLVYPGTKKNLSCANLCTKK